MDIPEITYAKTPDGVHIAYQVLGDAPIDLVFVHGFIHNLRVAWEMPLLARYYRRLASFSRLILFDRRGCGLSDRIADVPTLELRMDDIRTVMDAAGSSRAAIFGSSEGGPTAALFAATHPARTSALIMYGTYAKGAGRRTTHGVRSRRTWSARSSRTRRAGVRRSTPSASPARSLRPRPTRSRFDDGGSTGCGSP